MGKKRSKAYLVLALGLVALTLTACFPGENPVVRTPPPGGSMAGFLLGLWHGFVAPFTFVISLFTDAVNVYEVHNNGNWYDFGFVLGAGILFCGSGAGARGRRR